MTSSQRRTIIRVLVGVFLVWLAAIAWLRWTNPPSISQPATAVITHFRPGFGRIQSNIVTVTAQTPNGISGTDDVLSGKLIERNCQLGDRVSGEVVGIKLKFDALTCSPAKAGAQTAAAGSANALD